MIRTEKRTQRDNESNVSKTKRVETHELSRFPRPHEKCYKSSAATSVAAGEIK